MSSLPRFRAGIGACFLAAALMSAPAWAQAPAGEGSYQVSSDPAAAAQPVCGYASVNAYGDTAMGRTFHHEGATVLEGGKKVVDLNREVFVLRRINGEYKIALYIFNTNPVQGEG